MISAQRGISGASITGLGLGTVLSTARQAEAAGFGSFWSAEITGPESFSLLGAVGATAPLLDLGTGVIPIQIRNPQVVAMAAATLAALSPERTIRIGVGVSSPTIVDKWHGAHYSDRPLAQLREYVAVLRSCWTGEPVHFDGEFYRVSGFRLGVKIPDHPPEIVLGAVNPQMLALAGEIADGVLLNYLPASHVAWSVEQVRRGGDARIYALVHLGVGEPTEKARRYAQWDLYTYASAPAYRAGFARAGFADEMEQCEAARANGDREAALASISDSMIEGIDIFGPTRTVQAQWAAYREAGVEYPILMPLAWGPDRPATIAATIRAVA